MYRYTYIYVCKSTYILTLQEMRGIISEHVSQQVSRLRMGRHPWSWDIILSVVSTSPGAFPLGP